MHLLLFWLQVLEQESLERSLNANLSLHKQQLDTRLEAKLARRKAAAEEEKRVKEKHLELTEEQTIIMLTQKLISEKEDQEARAQEGAELEQDLREAENEKQDQLEVLQAQQARELEAANVELAKKIEAAQSDQTRQALFDAHQQEVTEQKQKFELQKAREDAKLQRRLNTNLERKKREREVKRLAEKEQREKQRAAEAERLRIELEESQRSVELEAQHVRSMPPQHVKRWKSYAKSLRRQRQGHIPR